MSTRTQSLFFALIILWAQLCVIVHAKIRGPRGLRRRVQTEETPILILVEGRPGLLTGDHLQTLSRVFQETYNASPECTGVQEVVMDGVEYFGTGIDSQSFTITGRVSGSLFNSEQTMTLRRLHVKTKSKGSHPPPKYAPPTIEPLPGGEFDPTNGKPKSKGSHPPPKCAPPTIEPLLGGEFVPTYPPPTNNPVQSPTNPPPTSPSLPESTLSPTVGPKVSPTNAPPTNAPVLSTTNVPVPSTIYPASTNPPPTSLPVPAPILSSTAGPTVSPTASLTAAPTARPTGRPTNAPPTTAPVLSTTNAPVPSTIYPALTNLPAGPSSSATVAPSQSPTESPSANPSSQPSVAPSDAPSAGPSSSPIVAPSQSPIESPSANPSSQPSVAPSDAPSAGPSSSPTAAPSQSPTAAPSIYPAPTTPLPTSPPVPSPTNPPPTSPPSPAPTFSPTATPTARPTVRPTNAPVLSASNAPVPSPTNGPTMMNNMTTSDGCWTQSTFVSLYNEEVRALDLDESIVEVVDVYVEEYVSCEESTDFESNVLVGFTGDPSLSTTSQLEALEDSFIQTYNELNSLNPDTCDPFFREVVSVDLIPSGQGRHLSHRNLATSFNYVYRVNGRCRGCGQNGRLFGEGSGRRFLGLGSRQLQEDLCVCPVDATEFRAPTEDEFQAGYTNAIEVLKSENVINPSFIESLEDIQEIIQGGKVPTPIPTSTPPPSSQNCGDEVTFDTTVLLELSGMHWDVTDEEMVLLANGFQDSYKAAASNVCDPHKRFVESVSISMNVESGDPTATFDHNYTATIRATCDGCNSQLFSVEGDAQETTCVCSSDVSVNRAPTIQEFAIVYNDTVTNLTLPNVKYVVGVLE